MFEKNVARFRTIIHPEKMLECQGKRPTWPGAATNNQKITIFLLACASLWGCGGGNVPSDNGNNSDVPSDNGNNSDVPSDVSTPPPGFLFTDLDGNAVPRPEQIDIAQLRDESGQPSVSFSTNQAVDFADMPVGRNAEIAFAHFSDSGNLSGKITLHIPCDKTFNTILVCPGAQSFSEVGADCDGQLALSPGNPAQDGYTFDNANSRLNTDDCEVSAAVSDFNTGAMATNCTEGRCKTTTWSSVASSRNHTCAVRTNGTLWCWGSNRIGQLGDGTTSNVTDPRPMTQVQGSSWVSVAAGLENTCGIRSDRTLWCWGKQPLGDSSTSDQSTPVQVPGASWVSVGTDFGHTCGTQADGALWCWGANHSGQLGDGTKSSTVTPTQVQGVSWESVVTGPSHTCGTQTDGTLWCWGSGLTAFSAPLLIPTQVIGHQDWSVVVANEFFVCGTKTDNTLWCWGNNGFGRLGDGTFSEHTTPNQVQGTWATVGAGARHACATRLDGTLWCWGSVGNIDGVLDADAIADQIVTRPGQIETLPTPAQAPGAFWTSVAPGGVCAFRSDGTLWCWEHGQPIDGTVSMFAATQVPDPT